MKKVTSAIIYGPGNPAHLDDVSAKTKSFFFHKIKVDN